jgi:hypothetical protein
MRPSNFAMLSGVDASVNQNSKAVDTENVVYASAMIIVTGSSTGTLVLQYSDDPVNPQVGPTNWAAIPNTSTVVSTAGISAIAKFDCSYQWIRANWTKNNGSAGTITVNFKSIGS